VSLEGRVEASLGTAAAGDRFQLERLGYFRVDEDSTDGLVLNRTITLRDTWAKAPTTKKKKASKKTKAKPPATEGTNATDAVDADPGLKALRDAIVAAGAETKAATNLVANDLRRVIGDGDPGDVDAGAVARLLALQADGTVSGGGVRKVLGVLVRDGGDPAELVDTLGLRAVEASALGPIVAQVLADHPGEVERFRGGETKLMGFLMGRVMRAAKGKADPKAASAMLREQLG
jgi:glutaminyl-tRNA synthetase